MYVSNNKKKRSRRKIRHHIVAKNTNEFWIFVSYLFNDVIHYDSNI